MTHVVYARIAAIFFCIAFALHLLRLIYEWQIEVNGWPIPLWISWVGVLVSGFLSAYGFRLSSRKK